MRPSAFATRPRRLQHVQRRRRDLFIACVHSNAGQAPAGRQAAPAALDLVLGRTGLNRMLLRSYHSPLNARARKAGSKASNSVEISFQAHPKKMTALFIGTWNDLHGVPGGGRRLDLPNPIAAPVSAGGPRRPQALAPRTPTGYLHIRCDPPRFPEDQRPLLEEWRVLFPGAFDGVRVNRHRRPVTLRL